MRVGLNSPSDLMSIVCGGGSAALFSSNKQSARSYIKSTFLSDGCSSGATGLVLVNLWLLRPFVKRGGSGSPDSDLFGTLVSLKGHIDRNLQTD